MPDKVQDYLLRGAAMLEARPNFKLVGRDRELRQICAVMMRKHASSVLLVGPGGVGCSSICLGLQAARDDASLPFDIMSKRLFWLDTDGLFATGNPARLSDAFAKLRRTLVRSAGSVLIIDDFRGFIDAARNNGATHLINAIMRDVSGGRYQSILEARDDDLEVVLSCHSNMREIFTMMDVREPAPDALAQILRVGADRLAQHHGIPVGEAALQTAIDLTNTYHVSDLSLSRAQPERSLTLLDRALTAFRQEVHANPPHIADLRWRAEMDPSVIPDLQQAEARWSDQIDRLAALKAAQKQGEELLLALEEDLAVELARETEAPEAPEPAMGFSARLGGAGFGSREAARLQAEIRKTGAAIARNQTDFDALTARINAGLELTAQQTTLEFSAISGIPADKLNQDERDKLLSLERALKARVFGQDHAVDRLVGAVLTASAGLKEPDKPQGSFMFCGPSGVGKTEIAKALTRALKDSEKAMLRFDMSEYMEKHAMAKLIGAPPGYEGYEAGGILTNSVRRNPHSVILFDEIEKAHPDVFNVFLQVLDDGRLTDNRGLTVSFADCLILMTTNIGQAHFLDPALGYDAAMQDTMDDLDAAFRPEFLNRFNGRHNIIGFKSLPLPLIERIALRELERVNARINAAGHDLQVQMAPDQIAALCRDRYDPAHGARGIPGFFASDIYPQVARAILSGDGKGRLRVTYEAERGAEVTLDAGVAA